MAATTPTPGPRAILPEFRDPATSPSGATPARYHAWSLAGTGAALGMQWLLLVVVARLGSEVDVGRFALALAVASPVLVGAGLGLRHVQMADDRLPGSFAQYVTLRGYALLVAVPAVLGVALFGPFDAPTAVAIVLMGVAKAVDACGELTFGALQRLGRYDLVARAQSVRGLAGLIGLAVGMSWRGLPGGLLGLGAGWLVSVLLVDLGNVRSVLAGGGAPSRPDVGALLRRSLPLGVLAVLWSTGLNLPRYALDHWHGPAALARFAVAAALVVPAAAAANALGQSSARAYALAWESGSAAARRRAARSGLGLGGVLGFSVLAVGLPAGAWLVEVVFGAGYRPDQALLAGVLVAGAAAAVATVGDYLLLAAGRFRTQLAIGGVTWIATAVATIGLVLTRNETGAAWALATGALAHLGATLAALRMLPPAPES